MPMHPKLFSLIAAVAVLALAGCGDDEGTTTTETVTETQSTSESTSTTTTSESTTTTEVTGGPVGPLEPAAIGPVAIGASEDEARAAFGEPDDVEEVNLGGGPAPQVTWVYEVEGGTVRLNFATDSGELRHYVVDTPSLETTEGIAVGSSRKDVLLAYGNGLPLAPIGDAVLVTEDGTEKPPALTISFDGKSVRAIGGGDLFQPAGE